MTEHRAANDSSSSGAFRVSISSDRRYFIDPHGEPWFLLGDTQWELFRMYSPSDVREILDARISQGFNTFLAMLNGVPEGVNGGMPGPRPWGDGRPPVVDASYFARVDALLSVCADYDALFIVGVYHKAERDLFSPETAREYARSVAARYRDISNIVWCMYPEADQWYTPVCRQIASGLADGAGGSHLITVHPDPSPASSSYFADERWIAFNMLQTCVGYDRIPPMLRADYDSLPTRPAVMAEGGYEGVEFGNTQGPYDIRKQAYWSFTAGGFFVYGHNDNYASPATWRSWIHSEGVDNIGVFRRTITGLDAWWLRVPDQSIISRGAGAGMSANTACRAGDGSWALVYLSAPTTVSLDTSTLKRGVDFAATWMDPRSGSTTPAGTLGAGEPASYTTPDGWEDAVLLLEAPPAG